MKKTCSKCKVEKLISEFYKNQRNKEGRDYSCKDCVRENRRIHYRNNLEKERQRHRLYRESNRKEINERGRLYREKNREKVRESLRKFRKNNPEKVRLNERKRRAMKRKVEENYTLEMEAFVHTFFGGKCYNCGTTESLTHDHHKALSRGHALEPGNAVLLCKPCNSSKGTKLPKNFYTREQLEEITTLLTHQAQLWSMGARIGK